MKNNILFLSVALIAFSSLQAQVKCEEIAGFKYDFCYDNALIPRAAAQFQLGANFFYYKPINGKKNEKIAFSNQAPLEYFVKLAEDEIIAFGSKRCIIFYKKLSKLGHICNKTSWSKKQK